MSKRTPNGFRKWSGRKKVLFAAIVLAVVLAFALDCRMVLQYYNMDAPEITKPVRIALVTDLHSCYYGKDQETLVKAIEAEAPDLILLGGDIFDDKLPDTNTECFLAGIAGKYPCYYVAGNHECRAGTEAFARKMDILKKHGVTILSGDCQTVTVNGQNINICGAIDPDAYKLEHDPLSDGYQKAEAEKLSVFDQQLDRIQAQAENGHFTILLSHRPELFEAYASRDFDLVLCGHAHGGQWRIPGILNGLYAPNQGLFPKYAGGQYQKNGTTMIVSRGLAQETTWVPRIFNPPELVVITVQ